MSGKTRNNIYRKSIGIDAQALPDIFTLAFIVFSPVWLGGFQL